MFRYLAPVSLFALVAFALPAMAQDTSQSTAQEQPAEQPEQEGQSAAENQLDLGQPASGEPQLGERYSKEKFGDWDLACIKTQAETDPCSLLQVMFDETGKPIAEISLFRLDGAGQAVAGATIIVPLETLLPAQLTVAVDEDAGKRYNYSYCNPIGCVAQIGLTQEDIDAFKRGAAATVSLVPAPAPDQRVTVKLSLSGFTAGYEVVDVVKNQ